MVSEEWMKKYFYAFIAGLFSGQVYIITAAYIAPIYKKETALVLLILAVLTIGAVMMTGYVNEEYNPWAENIGILIGLIIRYLMIDEEEKERLQRNKRA